MRGIATALALLIFTSSNVVTCQELTITKVRRLKSSLEFDLVLDNSGGTDLLIVAPNPLHRKVTSYYLGATDKPDVLEIRRNFYRYPPYVTDLKLQCFTLQRVKSGEIYKESISVDFPISPTYLSIPSEVNVATAKSARVFLGVLPFHTLLSEVQSRTSGGQCVDGAEIVESGAYRGKSLLDLQRLLESKVVSVELN